MKKVIWSIALLVILAVGFIIFNYERETTYGEVMMNLIGEEEEISDINIKYYSPNDDGKSMRLTEEDKIKKIIELPSNMKLKTTTADDIRETYFINVDTNKDSYHMRISNNGHIIVFSEDSRRYYKILGENIFLSVIESFNDKWKYDDKN